MDVIRRGGPWTAALLVLSLLVTTLALGMPATATTGDVLNVVPAGTTIATSCSSGIVGGSCGSTAGASTSFSDADDNTAVATKCTVGGVDYQHCTFTAVFSGTAPSIAHVRVYIKITGAHVFNVVLKQGGTSLVTLTADANTTSAPYDSGQVAVTLSGTGTVTLEMDADLANAGGVNLGSWELVAASGVGIETYCYNMRVGHPQFAWTGVCNFRMAFTGTVTLTTTPSNGTFHVGATGNATYTDSVSFTPVGGFGPGSGGSFTSGIDFSQDCFPACQSTAITLDILDTGNGQTASFTFLRSADGAVQVLTWLPIFISYSGCYNVSTNQCGHGSAAGKTDIEWAWKCNAPASAPDCTGSDSTVQIGPLNAATGGFTVTRYSVNTPGQAEGAYTAYALTTSTTQNRVWIIELANAYGTTRGSVQLDFVSGGNADSYQAPATAEVCGALDLGCALRNFFSVAASSVSSLVEDGVDAIHDAALTRQPFNFIVRAFDGVTAQLSRASDAVTTTSTCDGYAFTLPTPPPVHYTTATGTHAVTTWPSAVPAPSFVVLRCADLEPWGGTAWWQAIRTAMDPAIYLAWGLAQLRRLNPTWMIGA